MKRKQMGRAVHLYFIHICILHCCLSITKGSPPKKSSDFKFHFSDNQHINKYQQNHQPKVARTMAKSSSWRPAAQRICISSRQLTTLGCWLVPSVRIAKDWARARGPKNGHFWDVTCEIFQFFFLKVEFFVCLEHSKKTWKRLGKNQGFRCVIFIGMHSEYHYWVTVNMFFFFKIISSFLGGSPSPQQFFISLWMV